MQAAASSISGMEQGDAEAKQGMHFDHVPSCLRCLGNNLYALFQYVYTLFDHKIK